MPQKIKEFILDTLFPIECFLCRKNGKWICDECFSKIHLKPSQVCPYCERVSSPAGKICPACKINFLKKNKIVPLDNLITAAEYEKSGVSRLVHYYKYNFIRDLSFYLGKLMVSAIIKNNLPLPGIIIPVPLHKRRLRFRGFNQSELLADFIGQNLCPGFPIPVCSEIVIRKKYTPPQMKIKNYQERLKNLRNIFVLNNNVETHCNASLSNHNIKDKTVLLIDDISTTGSTLFECAKVLKSAGAKKVFAAVIARQKIK